MGSAIELTTAALSSAVKFCPYELGASSSLNAREALASRTGWLLRVQFSPREIGYADFHPLAPAKAAQESLLAAIQGGQNSQFSQSLAWAWIDAQARRDNKSLWTGRKIPHSHFLILDLLKFDVIDVKAIWHEGFRFIKIKLGRNSGAEQEALLELKEALSAFPLKLRLDFNAVNTPKKWAEWEHWLGLHLDHHLDYIEDPMPWKLMAWMKSRLPLALDLEWENAVADNVQQFDFLNRVIWKPALGLDFKTNLNSRCVVTHIMDHPVGQLGAIYWALENNINSVGGYLAGGLKDSLGFFEEVKAKGPELIAPLGTGWGFDERLSDLQWQTF